MESGQVIDPLREKARAVHEKLFAFYGPIDWRDPLPAVDELVSTILSQNTNDRNRDKAFESLRRKFPTWKEVMEAKPEDVITAIRIAGLAHQKGPRIQAVLRQIVQERGSLDLSFLADMPVEEARAWLMHFNGVGPKTAAIVLQFSMDIPAFPVDTHVYRVTTRLGLTPAKMSVEQAHAHLSELFEPANYKVDHLNIIRLGREICAARNPQHERCPLSDICDYYREIKEQQAAGPVDKN